MRWAFAHDLALRDDNLAAGVLQPGDEPVAVIGAVGDDELSRQVEQQLARLGQLVPLARREGEPDRSALPIDDEVDLGCQAASASPDGLTRSPLLVRREPPLAC